MSSRLLPQYLESLELGGVGQVGVERYECQAGRIAFRCNDGGSELEGVGSSQWMDFDQALGDAANLVDRDDLIPGWPRLEEPPPAGGYESRPPVPTPARA